MRSAQKIALDPRLWVFVGVIIFSIGLFLFLNSGQGMLVLLVGFLIVFTALYILVAKTLWRSRKTQSHPPAAPPVNLQDESGKRGTPIPLQKSEESEQDRNMQAIQFFETTVAERDHNYAVHFITLPTRAMEGERQKFLTGELENTDRKWADLLGGLGLQNFEALPLSLLPYAIALMLQGYTAEAISDRLQRKDFDDLLPELVSFAEYASFAQVVPFEQSPLDLHSMAEILTKGSPLAIGVWLGIAAMGGTTGPVLFGAVATGIIFVFGAEAVGISLRYHILHFLRVPGNSSEEQEGESSDKKQKKIRESGGEKPTRVKRGFFTSQQMESSQLKENEAILIQHEEDIKTLDEKLDQLQEELDEACKINARLEELLEKKEPADTSRYAVNSPPVHNPKKLEKVAIPLEEQIFMAELNNPKVYAGTDD